MQRHVVFEISIHAPREGGDDRLRLCGADGDRFQSTPPARGATLLQKAISVFK